MTFSFLKIVNNFTFNEKNQMCNKKGKRTLRTNFTKWGQYEKLYHFNQHKY